MRFSSSETITISRVISWLVLLQGITCDKSLFSNSDWVPQQGTMFTHTLPISSTLYVEGKPLRFKTRTCASCPG